MSIAGEVDLSDSLLRGIAKELSAYVLEELQKQRQGDEWIDQFRSPLCLPGQDHSRRHCNIVKRRIRNRMPGAYISPDGKQYFLTTTALAEECSGAEQESGPDVAKIQPDPTEDGYEGMMRLIRGGSR